MIQHSDMDLEHGSKSSVNSGSLLDGAGTIANSSGSSKNFEVLDGRERNKYSIHKDAIANEHNIVVGSSSSSSSSSSDSSIDLLQLNKNEDIDSIPRVISLNEQNGDAQTPVKYEESSFLDNILSKSEEYEHSSMASTLTFQASDVAQDSMKHFIPLTESPPIQTMERSEYDPFRIPSSVFEGNKSTTPMEWSVASNESLFSIHLGNNSFTKERLVMLGGMSGELTKSGELLMFSPTPPAPLMDIEKKNCEAEKDFGAEEVAVKINTDAETECSEDPSLRIPPPAVSSISSTLSRRTDGSVTSTRSFAFPIKKKCEWKCAWTSCYCCNCSKAFCFMRPRCYRPRCSWAFCYSLNCSLKRCCCHSHSMMSEGLRTDCEKVESEVCPKEKKVDSEEQHLETLKTTPTANHCCPVLSWFSWCSCHSCCSCHTCWSCHSCHSCCSCHSCHSCCSCHSCYSFHTCRSCCRKS